MSAESRLREYCKRKNINPDGQFIQQDGHLFIDGYLTGERDANRTATKFMRLSKEATRQQNERIKELEDDLLALRSAVKTVLEEELSGVSVHPCDEHSEDVKARGLPPIMRRLYEVFHDQK